MATNVDNLFDYINVMFSNDDRFDELSIGDKSKHTFMLGRFMSIKYPLQANLFNTLGINPLGVSESWRIVTKNYGKVPGWIYTKTKKAKAKQNKEVSEESIKAFMKFNEMDDRSFSDAMRFFPEQTVEKILLFDKRVNQGYEKQKK